MELRQLRYFVRAVEAGSMGRAAADLGVVQSALSQQISRLEGELATRLLQRSSRGVIPTEAGVAFFREAQLTLRHAEQAQRAAQMARLTGTVSVGMAGTTLSVLGMPFMRAMKERYPDVRLHIVELLSSHLAAMLNARQLDLAILFTAQSPHRWSIVPLLEERLLLIQLRRLMPAGSDRPRRSWSTREVGVHPLILPTKIQALRLALETVFQRARVPLKLVAEIDSMSLLMEAVDAGYGATVQPGAAMGRYGDAAERFHFAPMSDRHARRLNTLCSLPDEELSPAALAARIVLADTARTLVTSGSWPGAVLAQADPN